METPKLTFSWTDCTAWLVTSPPRLLLPARWTWRSCRMSGKTRNTSVSTTPWTVKCSSIWVRFRSKWLFFAVLFGWCCPLCMICDTAKRLEENVGLYCVLGYFCAPCTMCMLRKTTRERYGIEVRISFFLFLLSLFCQCSNKRSFVISFRVTPWTTYFVCAAAGLVSTAKSIRSWKKDHQKKRVYSNLDFHFVLL